MSKVRVKRKGQATIPVHLRRKFNIQEGSLLIVEERKEGILFKCLPPVKAGDVVGEKAYGKLFASLMNPERSGVDFRCGHRILAHLQFPPLSFQRKHSRV